MPASPRCSSPATLGARPNFPKHRILVDDRFPAAPDTASAHPYETWLAVEVEQVIAELPGVVEVGVIGVPDEHWGESVAAFVVRAPDAAIDARAVIAHCREHLASYKKPRCVLFVENLPRNTTNKVDKNVLRRQFADHGPPARPDDPAPNCPRSEATPRSRGETTAVAAQL